MLTAYPRGETFWRRLEDPLHVQIEKPSQEGGKENRRKSFRWQSALVGSELCIEKLSTRVVVLEKLRQGSVGTGAGAGRRTPVYLST